jgi:3-hydroxybutyrate dehydrogenase
MNIKSVSNKTALVTGAASGIGFALAQSLSEQGMKVLITDMNLDAAQQASEKLNATGGNTVAYELDVTSQQQIDEVFAQVKADSGTLDILVNNAGIQHVEKLETFPVDRWKLIMDVLLVAPAMLTRVALPLMRANNFGRIINIGSLHSLVASPYKSAYVAAKHGLLGFSKVVALETAEQDITINTICPAYVKTPLVEKQIASQAKEHGLSEDEVVNNIMLEPMPKKSFISFEELSGAMNYLISDVARNMTAQTMVLDGAWTAK